MMEKLKDFMLLFRFEPGNEAPTQKELNEMHQQWGHFIGGIAAQGKLVSTHQLGFEGKQIKADKSITEGVHVSEKQIIGGNMILKAETLDEALEFAKKSPILFMGGSVEVRSIQPMNE